MRSPQRSYLRYKNYGLRCLMESPGEMALSSTLRPDVGKGTSPLDGVLC